MRASLLSAAFAAALGATTLTPAEAAAQVYLYPNVWGSYGGYGGYLNPGYRYNYRWTTPYYNTYSYGWSNPFNYGAYRYSLPNYGAYYRGYYGYPRYGYGRWGRRW